MASTTEKLGQSPLATLRQFVRKPRERQHVCELCAKPLASTHRHLLDLDKRQVKCACEACSILFGSNTRQRYRRVPVDVYRLKDFVMDDHEWESLLIPINLAFFVRSSTAGRMVAQYPSPGGVMESSLDLEYWETISQHNPVLNQLEPDVEALLVKRIGDTPQYFRVPIDKCFHLVGIIRSQWRGLSGGETVWKEIDRFFDELNLLSGTYCA